MVARKHTDTPKKVFSSAKRSNLVISADLTDRNTLLVCAEGDLVSNFGSSTVRGLKVLAEKHSFIIFEDRKLVDIGITVQKQYHGASLRISEWPDVVSLGVQSGDRIVEAEPLDQTVTSPDFPFPDQRAFLLPHRAPSSPRTQSRSAGICAPGQRISLCRILERSCPSASSRQEIKGDKLDQWYQTPASAVFIYTASDSVEATKRYQAEGWTAYIKRTL
ncbi:Orotidine 5'-phosphate decarboxylase [Podospora didyma]|uniref:Orotidine 5'-phosphate decarboxylase n=1 Tax=Podospora didyma TaxID=330526 RepID=A0AAE0NUA4_9PEZI|nr:Orotidine 5'-phosphate decarboxylase [Podospora didyma]